MFRGKKYQDAAKQIEKNTQYDAAEVLSPYFLWKMPRRMPRPMLQSLASCAR